MPNTAGFSQSFTCALTIKAEHITITKIRLFFIFFQSLLVFKPIDIYIAICLAVALRKEAEHDTSEAADGLGAEKTVFHLGQFYEVSAVGRCLQIVIILVGSDAKVGTGTVEGEILFAVAGLT